MPYFSNDACVPKSILKQQEFQKNKLAEDFKKLKKPIRPKLESKTVNTLIAQPRVDKVEGKNDLDSYKKFANTNELKKMTFSTPVENTNEKVIFFTSSNKNNPFSNGNLADCGFKASWLFKCAPYKPLPICLENRSDGAWVPFIIQYNEKYMLCSNVKNGSGREFSQDYGNAYR